MLLLHGLGESTHDWENVLPDLAADHYVWAVDLRGHGSSPHPGTYSFELMRDDVLAFLDTHAIGPCVMIGHSMGGLTALLLAELDPSRLTHLILEDVAAPRLNVLHREPLDPPDEPTPFDFAAVNPLFAQLSNPDPAWWEHTRTLPTPTLVIGGGTPSTIPQTLLADMVAQMPHATLTTIEAGHDVHATHPTEFLTAVTTFLKSSL
ncbi:alpha/beta fold hydrolase [Winogradskya consettensis]|uniref:alpha/beta fold hydrolase n=1 Tax=Winogradskya consettensis TaxID=113560 RepID=UPI001BB3B97F|nr:alpha/beta fold hydrolase [Actinoplanes consettensis]